MKKLTQILLFCTFIFTICSSNSHASDNPVGFEEIIYVTYGSCESKDLSFNAARFTKIPLNRTRDDLAVYLQVVVFIHSGNIVNVRTQEMGLVSCRQTNEGEVCGYKPFNDTKKYLTASWELIDKEISIEHLGSISKVRDDFPWLGFQLKFDQDFFEEVLRNQSYIGGKVQLNFNHEDQNVSKICRPQ